MAMKAYLNIIWTNIDLKHLQILGVQEYCVPVKSFSIGGNMVHKMWGLTQSKQTRLEL